MKVILFDIDGTLIHTGGAGRDAIYTALKREFEIHQPHPIDLSGRTDRGIARELFDAHDIEHSAENWERFRAAYLMGLEEHLVARQGHVLPGVHDLVAGLKVSPDVSLGLLTGNVREGARRKLMHYGLFEHFAFGGYGDTHPERDDVAREAFLAAQAHLQRELAGQHVWVIGDTPLDIRCARAIGAQVVAVATGAFSVAELHTHRPDVAVENLAGTVELLERLMA